MSAVRLRESTVVHMIGGSTVVLEIGGLRMITDPTFDPPAASPDGMPHRLTHPALTVPDVGRLDVALVSHDQHPDNLDRSGRALLAELPLVLTTPAGAQRLGGSARGLARYKRIDLASRFGPLTVTAVPAQHGPVGAEAQTGPVTGFLLAGDALPTVYVSGDNASLDVVRDIAAQCGPVDLALLFCGSAQVPGLLDGQPLTLTSKQTVQAAGILGARAVVPVHCDGWSHYTEGGHSVRGAFSESGLPDVVHVLAPGEVARL